MKVNESETVTGKAYTPRSLFFCLHLPSFTWELEENTIPWAVFGITVFSSPFIVLLNVLEIIAVSRKKRLQRVSTVLLRSMAVADVLVGALSMPLTATVDLLTAHQTLLDHVCIFHLVGLAAMYCAGGTVVLHSAFIAWERFLAVKKWRVYKVIVTQRLMKKLVVVAWMPAAIIATPYVMIGAGVDLKVYENLALIRGIGYVFFIVLIIYFNTMVYLELRKRKRIKTLKVNSLIKEKLDSKVAKMTVLMTCAMLFSFLLPEACLWLGYLFPVFRKNSAFRWYEILMQLHSLVNPLINCFKERCLRNTVLKLLRFKKSEPIRPTLRFVKQMKPLSPQEDVLENQIDKKGITFRRTTPIPDSVFVIESVYDSCNRIRERRSMSVPSLEINSTRFRGLHTHQRFTSCNLTSTITVNAHDDARQIFKNRDPRFPPCDVQLKQVPRAESKDVTASIDLVCCCQDSQHNLVSTKAVYLF